MNASLCSVIDMLVFLLGICAIFIKTIDCAVVSQNNDTLMIGYVLPSIGWPVGPTIGSAIILAIEELDRRQILPGYKVDWIMRDDHCEQLRGMQMLVEMWGESDKSLDVIVGPGCSVVCQPLAL